MQGDTLEYQANFLGLRSYLQLVGQLSFQRYKARIQAQKLEQKCAKYEAYNEPFCLALSDTTYEELSVKPIQCYFKALDIILQQKLCRNTLCVLWWSFIITF